MNTAETIAYYQGLTKRQLFKAYRDAVTHLNECNTVYNTGHDFLHGERIVPYQRAAQEEVYNIEKVLSGLFSEGERAVPKVPAKVKRFTIDQRRDFIRERDAQREKTSLENTIARFKVGAIIQSDLGKELIVGNYTHNGQTLIDTVIVYTYDNGAGMFTGTTRKQFNVNYLLENNYKIV